MLMNQTLTTWWKDKTEMVILYNEGTTFTIDEALTNHNYGINLYII